jgi:protein tyrosine/serine phosphatase
MRTGNNLLIFISAAVLFAGSATAADQPTNSLPSKAASLDVDGAPNLHRVSTNLYRSAQPTMEGMRNMEELGIKTVINLRSFHSDRDELKGTRLGYEHIYMKAWHPEEKEAVKFLKTVTDPEKTPVLVHCLHGSDRTGAMCAIYRIAVQGWSRDDAITEMTEGGFGFHEIFNNIPKWIRNLDIEAIKEEAGITGTR